MDCQTHSPEIYIILSKFWSFELLYLVKYIGSINTKIEDFLKISISSC